MWPGGCWGPMSVVFVLKEEDDVGSRSFAGDSAELFSIVKIIKMFAGMRFLIKVQRSK